MSGLKTNSKQMYSAIWKAKDRAHMLAENERKLKKYSQITQMCVYIFLQICPFSYLKYWDFSKKKHFQP